jgi:hypothetical protein
VKDIRELGGEFYATVEGRHVETGNDISVRGKIVSVDFEESEEVASMIVETEEGEEYTVGGLVAALEDIEGQDILLGRNEPPERQ